MRIVAALSWYDESPSWLAACVASAARLCDHLVAVDGAYHLYPDAKAQSPSLQAETITETAHASGIGLTLHRPQTVWFGNEVQKRTHVFRLATLECEPFQDWILSIDADMIITHVPPDIRDVLRQTELNVATYQLWAKEDWHQLLHDRVTTEMSIPQRTITDVRALLRAMPNLRVEGYHYHYVCEDQDGNTTALWAEQARGHHQEDALPTDLEIEHRLKRRDGGRRHASDVYYKTRDQLGIEHNKVNA